MWRVGGGRGRGRPGSLGAEGRGLLCDAPARWGRKGARGEGEFFGGIFAPAAIGRRMILYLGGEASRGRLSRTGRMAA
jgi:hypothetical protein